MQRRVFMSVLVVALMGVFSLANAAEEGDKKGKGKGPDVMQAALEKANLSAEQKEKIKAIRQETAAAMKAAREAKDKEAGKKAIMDSHEKVMAVLTDEQKEIVKKYLAENRPEKGDKKKKQD